MNPTLTFGNPNDEWSQYGLYETPVVVNCVVSGYKAITQEDHLVCVVSDQYKLIPNQEAVKVADQAAELAGLVPFNEFTGEWISRLSNHVITDHEKHRVHALYASNQPYEVQGEKMHIGVGVHNSIDGSTSFGCGIFTFRHACANMVLAGMRGYTQEFDQRKTIEGIYKRHTAGLIPVIINLKNAILSIMEKANTLIETYNKMATEKAEEELLTKIRKSRLPKKILSGYLQEDAVETPQLSKWEVYNDLTAAIWHNPKSDLRTKEFQFNTVHAVLKVR